MTAWIRYLTGAAACLTLGLALIAMPAPAYAGTPAQPDVYVDGELLHFDVQPRLVHNRTLVPLRMIFESLGAGVTWDGSTSTVTALENGTTLRLKIGSTAATVNGKTVTLDVPAELIQGRTMVPVRFIAESLGDQVEWNGKLGQVLITSRNAPLVRVIGADPEIQDGEAAAIQKLLEERKLTTQDEQVTGLTYQQPVWVYLTHSDAGYLQAITTYLGRENADLLAKDSSGVADQSRIVIPLQRNQGSDEQADTLAHELFHVLVNQNGADTLPSWINEGMAWQLGLTAHYANQSDVMRGVKEGQIRSEVLQAVKDRTLLPLVDDPETELTSIDKVTYDLEWQDYLAEQYLVQTYGAAKLQAYLQKFPQERSRAFEDVFGLSEQAFEQKFLADLDQQVNEQAQGVELTLQVSSDFQGDFAILPQGSTTWRMFRLTPGTDTIRIYKNGTVDGINVTATDRDTKPPDTEAVYLAVNPDHPQPVQGAQGVQTDQAGLVIIEAFGKYFLNNAYVYPSKGDVQYPDTDTLYGVKLVGVQNIE